MYLAAPRSRGKRVAAHIYNETMYPDVGVDIADLPDLELSIRQAVFEFRAVHHGMGDADWRIKAYGPSSEGKFKMWVTSPGNKKPYEKSITATPEAARTEILAWLDELCPMEQI